MSTVQPSDFNQFCDFVVQIRDHGGENLTPEQSVEQFRVYQEKLRIWNERNAISAEQARRGEAKPLDDDAVIRRLYARFAKHNESK